MRIISGDTVRIVSSAVEGIVLTVHHGRLLVAPERGRARIARDVELVTSYELRLARQCADRGMSALRADDVDAARSHAEHASRYHEKAVRRAVDHHTELALTGSRISHLLEV